MIERSFSKWFISPHQIQTLKVVTCRRLMINVLIKDVVRANNSIIGNISINLPKEMAFDPGNGLVYVASGNGFAQALNGTTKVGEVLLGYGDWSFSYDSKNKDLYVSSAASDIVTVINSSNQVVTTLDLGTFQMTYDASRDWILVVTQGYLTLVDSENIVVGLSDLGANPSAVVYPPENG